MSVFYIGIRVYGENGVWKAETTSRKNIVCGNSEAYGITLSYEGEGWSGMTQTLHITTSSLDGDQTEYTLTSLLSNNITLPAFENATVARVHITRGDRTTTIPATITCEPSVTDGSGIEDNPGTDIYNLMTEYIAQRRAGSQTRADALLAQLQELRETAAPAYPGDDYRRTAKRSERVTTVTGTLTLADDTTITITDDMITANTLKLAAEAISSDAFIPGGVPSTELRVTLRLGDIEPGDLYEARMELTYHIQRHDEHWCEIALGAFTITEAKAPKPGYADITAYDDMLKLTRLSRGKFGLTTKEYYTFAEVLTAITTAAGVEWDGVIPRDDLCPHIKPAEMNTGIETGRDLLGWIAQIACATALFDPEDGKLHLRAIDPQNPVESYTEGDSLAHAVSNLGYQLFEIQTTVKETDFWTKEITGPKRYIANTLWEDGVTVELPENLLFESTYYYFGVGATPRRATGESEVRFLAEWLDPVVFTPGEVQIFGDPALRLLEWITVRTEAGDATFPITRSEWVYRGAHKLESGGMETVAGVEKTMAEKRNLGSRIKQWGDGLSEERAWRLMIITSEGHEGMSLFTHDELHHFTHEVLGTKGEYYG